MSEQIVMIDPRILKDHPRNAEFFDNVDGAEFDRLVESIGDHGVLTPLRVTKDMTIISGHQRKRAAIKAECFEVPVIVDSADDDDDVTMKLIETNFGRVKNDPIKQARWIKEYEALKGVRQGSAGRALKSLDGAEHRPSTVSQDDIAAELGISPTMIRALKRLLKIDPDFQTMISEGRMSAKTGYNIVAKLSPEEQRELLDLIPDDVKLNASSIQEYIIAMKEAKDKRIHELEDTLSVKQHELLAAQNNSDLEESDRNKKLIQEKRKYYEQWQRTQDQVEKLQEKLSEAKESLRLAEAKAVKDEAVSVLEDKIKELQTSLNKAEAEADELRENLDEANRNLADAERKEREGFLRYACPGVDDSTRDSVEQIQSLFVQIQTVVGNYNTSVRGLHLDADLFPKIPKNILKTLVETVSAAVDESKKLYIELLGADNSSDENSEDDNAVSDDSHDDLFDDDNFMDDIA